MHRRSNHPHASHIEILLVENNSEDAELVMNALIKNRIHNRVTHFSKGSEAIDFLYGNNLPDNKAVSKLKLIILELYMQDTSGIEMLRMIRSDYRTSNIPVIVLSDSAPAADLIECYQLGISSFVIKPHGPVEYINEVSNMEFKKILTRVRT